MNDNELKKLWQEQPLPDPPPAAQLISVMQRQTSELRRCLNARDLREILACAVVIVIFWIFYFTEYRTPVSRLGDLMVIGGVIFIGWKILHTRWATRPAPPGASMIEALRAELNSVRAQARLLGSVLWWYILPGFIGVVIATWGLHIDLGSKIGCTLVFAGVDALVYWLNRMACARQLLPLAAQLESLLHCAETGEPLGDSEVSMLRPIIALSKAGADQVQPVEFKVAFWQIALFGEIGFLVMWLFLMLGLSGGRGGLTASDETTKSFTPGVTATESNRYAAVARVVVERFNVGDYAGVQRLYDQGMSAAFPARKTTDFYANLAEEYGKIETITGPVGQSEGWFIFRLHGGEGDLKMSLALDKQNKISGIYFRPIGEGTSFLSWKHLVWLPIFFIGGLLFSWALQKTTERAVGISAAGVHLHGGREILLWDEITEARPLRVLNIRSLWLVRPSGEKTIMGWTSLERHGELKAAVEKFAPANHPIRKYLPLLRH